MGWIQALTLLSSLNQSRNIAQMLYLILTSLFLGFGDMRAPITDDRLNALLLLIIVLNFLIMSRTKG